MCGIFGISYGPEGPAGEVWTPTEFAQLMFPAIVHRGPHAFGWFSYNPSTGITYDKYVGKVTLKRNADKVLLDDEASWFVCHVRYATKGNPQNNNNNHPLISGNVIGVHNGTLSGDWQGILDEVGRENPDATVDSEAIFAAVSKWGVTEGIKKIDGNMVAVIADTSHPEVLHIARSYGRPLVYATTPAGSLIFASECCVIDACGVDLVPVGQTEQGDVTAYTEVKGQYRLFKVVGGKIVSRSQYRTPAPKTPVRTPVRVPFEDGGVSGITDYFDRAKTLDRGRVGWPGRSPSSLDEPLPSASKSGTRKGSVDRWGGEYLGAGWYRVQSGKVMPVAEYVEWRVQQELERQRHMEDAFEAAAASESQAQDIINNNFGG